MFFGYNNGINMQIVRWVLIALVIYSLATMGTASWIYLLLTLPGVILAVSFHEYAHAWMATKFGDTTPRSQGRLTLNPAKHLDMFGFFLMMFTSIGWGKPVEINPNNFTSNKSKGFCETMVALAGPFMNFILAIISMVVYFLIYAFAWNFANSNGGSYFMYFIELFIKLNIGLGVFNLIPLPPLDGEKIFRNVIPYKFKEWIDANYLTLYYVFMLLYFFGILNVIVDPVISTIFNGLYYGVGHIFYLFIK